MEFVRNVRLDSGELFRTTGSSVPCIPLSEKAMDNPMQFAPYNRGAKYENYERLRKRLEHYNIYLYSSGIQNPPSRGPSIGSDAEQTLVFFSEFGSTDTFDEGHKRLPGKPEALAVCGFNVRMSTTELHANSPLSSSGLVMEIAQFQTAFNKEYSSLESEKEMIKNIGFFRFKDAFAHVLEQMAISLSLRGIPFEYISVEKTMRSDESRAKIRRGLIASEEEVHEELARLVQEREIWAKEREYTEKVKVLDGFGNTTHQSFAKRVSNINPDHQLQDYLNAILSVKKS